jgi:hypothetical protein
MLSLLETSNVYVIVCHTYWTKCDSTLLPKRSQMSKNCLEDLGAQPAGANLYVLNKLHRRLTDMKMYSSHLWTGIISGSRNQSWHLWNI